MNRQLEFRAWDKVDKKIRKVDCINFFDEYVNLDENLDGHCISRNIRDINLMQFTGLLDKNEKKIYEGDIVEYTTDYYDDLKTHKICVEWDDDIENDSFGCPLTMGYVIRGYDLKILGNVYENPELLNGEKR